MSIACGMAGLGACTSGGTTDEDDGAGGSGSATAAGTSTGTAAGTTTGTATATTTGTSTGSGMGTSTGTQSCFGQPDFEGCIDCLCTIEQAGCAAYTQALIDTILCGQSCGATACADFCTGARDQISQMCVDCASTVEDGPDVDAFVQQCEATPACDGFLMTLRSCPQG